jgi:NAD(P)-dependent dehydrogenase (short-subunit alcohol dehydrogenase family)
MLRSMARAIADKTSDCRMGRPEELVAAVRYLCSDDDYYVTGSMLILDGGYTAR